MQRYHPKPWQDCGDACWSHCAGCCSGLVSAVCKARCIVKGEAQKSPLFWRFSGGFWFSQDRLFSRNSTRKALNLIKSLIFTNAPCKSTCLYNAPSMHTVEKRRCKIRGNLNRYTKRPRFCEILGRGNLRYTEKITGFPANIRNPQGGKSTDFSVGKCHLLYFAVVPESLKNLSDRPKYPPYRETSVAIPLSHYVSCGIADYRCYTPTSFCKQGLSRSKTDPTRGVSQKKLASEAYRAVGGVARNSIASRAIVGH